MSRFSNDSDEDETFVTLGTGIDIPDEDEPKRKPVSVHDLQVKDSKGRARFHGAFTGGFSAGFFNTVGSQKGWTPSTFISSREKREDRSHQKPEDFMDEEDLGEYGIAPRKLVTAGSFSSEERKKRRMDELTVASADAVIPGTPALLNLIVPEKITIGVKLLRKMGWKEGQGVGPRLNKKQKKREKAGMKVYGCQLPASPGSDNDLDDDTFLTNMTFAPRDATQVFLSVKANTHGLGYRGLDPRTALHSSSHVQLFEPPRITKSGRRGIKGQGFGVGALEEDDDDIYGVDDMSNYDMTMGGEEKDSNFGWTGPSKRGPVQTPVGYIGQVLKGFTLSSSKLVQKKLFPPPELPRGFRPVHIFPKPEKPEASQVGTDYRQFLRPDTEAVPTVSPTQSSDPTRKAKPKDATERSLALGEEAFVGSVFDLIPKEDKDRIKSGKPAPPSNSELETGHQSADQTGNQRSKDVTEDNHSLPKPSEKFQSIDEQRKQNVPLYQSSMGGFKPFAKNPKKQERYDRYLALVKQGHSDPYRAVAEDGQTEWEREREKEEFGKAAKLYKPLATMMAMRFTTGSQHDDKDVAASNREITQKSEAEKAAEMKMYGKLTREVLEWHPDRLVCKRFNVPDPYPGSNIVGLASVKRDKYSVFNFLDFAHTEHSSDIPSIDYTPSNSNNMESSEKSELSKESIKSERTSDTKHRSFKDSFQSEKNKERESKVDRILNQGQKMKSIFSHLMDPPGKSSGKSGGVSFTVKSVKPKEQKEMKSVFDEDSQKQSKQVAMETDEKSGDEVKDSNKSESEMESKAAEKKEIKTDDGKADMDLFRAIFKNTDSEDSSSSDEEEEMVTEDSAQATKDSVIQTRILPTLDTSSTYQPLNSFGPSQSASEGLGFLPGNNQPLESIAQRLSPGKGSDSDDSESYGPSLPPPPVDKGSTNTTPTSSLLPSASFHSIDLTKDSSKKHKHKDRHKDKKEKKEKHKKSKHKKKNKKKDSKKKKKRRRSTPDSSDTSDKESDSEEETLPSDMEILNRMKKLKPCSRAADFF